MHASGGFTVGELQVKSDTIFYKALSGERLQMDEAVHIYRAAPLEELMLVAMEMRQRMVPGNSVGWIVDRNVNITNVCFSQCSFCNFCRKKNDADAYVTTLGEYREKISGLFALGGDQLLLQGGMNPALGLPYYEELFSRLKGEFPLLKLHALGPPEVAYLAAKESLPVRTVLERLHAAGLDSLPGAGAEILSDRVRKIVSPAKATTAEWLGVMREAHKMNLPTSATMMFGQAETDEERVEHLMLLRGLQDERPEGHWGFITFVPWPFQDEGTRLAAKQGIRNSVDAAAYIRMVALSRIVLDNITNIQSSLLTVGADTAMVTLHAGANDLGSIMIEENVVSAAGAGHRYDADGIQDVIRRAGFIPRRRDQRYLPV
jgi:cyclic dehypoxanthinyl futalosine synthase